MWHFSFHVEDLDTSVDFYERVLGLELVHRQEQSNEYTRALVGFPDASLRIAQLRVPGQPLGCSSHHLDLVEYVAPRGAALRAGRNRPGTSHLAFAVTDIHETYDRLHGLGVAFVSPPQAITAGANQGGYACYFVDPDSITLELVQPPPQTLSA